MQAVDAGLLDTIVKLVNLGFAGVGVVVLLLLFIILLRDRPADAETNRLRHRFLTWGMSFAFFCGVLAVILPLTAPRPTPDRSEMLLSFSPRFETEGLPSPRITLPDGRSVPPGERFPAQQGQVLVSVDEALKDVSTLKEAAITLAATAAAAQKQADAALAALASSQGPPPAPVAGAAERARDASRDSQAASAAIATAIKSGDFDKLETQSRTLETASKASIAARTRVIRSF